MADKWDHITVVSIDTDLVKIVYNPPYTWGDSFQHSQGKQAASKALETKKILVEMVQTIEDPVEGVKVLAVYWRKK